MATHRRLIEVDDQLWKRVKAECVRSQTRLIDAVNHALQHWLVLPARSHDAPPREKVRPEKTLKDALTEKPRLRKRVAKADVTSRSVKENPPPTKNGGEPGPDPEEPVERPTSIGQLVGEMARQGFPVETADQVLERAIQEHGLKKPVESLRKKAVAVDDGEFGF